MPRRSPALTLSLFLTSACASTPWTAVDTSLLRTPKDYPGAGIVVLLDSTRVEWAEDSGEPIVRTRRHKIVQLLSDRGREYAALSFGYDRSFSKITHARARTRTPQAVERTYEQDEMLDVLAQESSILFADGRILFLNFESLPLSSYIEWEITAETKPAHLFRERTRFGGRHPVVEARLEVDLPPGWTAEHRAEKLGETIELPPKEEKNEQGGVRWSWQMKDLPAFEVEPYGPDYEDALPQVKTRLLTWTIGQEQKKSFADFGDLSAWLHELQDGTAAVTPEIEAKVKEILAGAPPDQRERARLLYEWVQSQIRYVAVEIGLGGFRPHTAPEVFDTRYGDCKDKATLLKAMLKSAGIESRLATLYSHRGFPRRLESPTLDNANHAILVIDLGTEQVVVDPTSRTVPFGELPVSDQGAELLPVSDRRLPPFFAAESRPEQNLKSVRLVLDLDPATNKAKGRFTLRTRGVFLSDLKRDLVQYRGRKLRREIQDWIGNSRARVSGAGDLKTDELSGKLSIPNLSRGTGDSRVVSLAQIVGTFVPSLAEGERKTPVLLRARSQRMLEVELSLPEGWRATVPAEALKVSTKHGRYELTWSYADRKLTARAVYEQQQPVVPAGEYQELLQLFDSVQRAETQLVVLERRAS